MVDMPGPRSFRLNFVGDVMLGRLIDQLFKVHVHEPSEARIISQYLDSYPDLHDYGPRSPWGSTLSLFLNGDLNLINLETSATTHPTKWPQKVFNYRMHPANIEALHAARVDYASLANNHTLDFCEEGLTETVRTLKQADISFAGAGESRDEALRPAILALPRTSISDAQQEDKGKQAQHSIHVFSASDHPSDWSKVPSFHLIDYGTTTRARLKSLLTSPQPTAPALRVFSVHWGPNYSWRPSSEIRSLAHFLIDECGVDIIHGHSSHHVQGVEKHNGKLIIYGCGDFVDDYAIDGDYRNDLSALWRVTVAEDEKREDGLEGKLRLKQLEILPTRIKRFQAERLGVEDWDHEWVKEKIVQLSGEYGTKVREELGAEGQLVINLSG